MLVTTFAVVVAPLLAVVWLRDEGVLMSAWAGVLVAVAGSLAVSSLGGMLWKRTAHSGDMLFSDLMVWGWLHRWRSARRVEAATALLASRGGLSSAISGRELDDEQKTALLAGLIGDLEGRDPYTNGHSRRVARHAADIATQMGLERREVAKIRAAGAVHDVGKVHTPVAILHKPGALSEEEFAVVAHHPVSGADMVEVLGDPELTAMVRHHHERLDGAGYPDGLGGEGIPLGARILAVADTFDAITSTRSYRRAHSHDEALRILARGAGTQHDPEAVRAFERCYAGHRPVAMWAGVVNAVSRVTPAFGASAGGGATGVGSAGVGTAGAWIAAATVAAGGIGISTGLRAPDASGAQEGEVSTTVRATAAASPSGAPSGRQPKATRSSQGATGFKRAALRAGGARTAAPALPGQQAPAGPSAAAFQGAARQAASSPAPAGGTASAAAVPPALAPKAIAGPTARIETVQRTPQRSPVTGEAAKKRKDAKPPKNVKPAEKAGRTKTLPQSSKFGQAEAAKRRAQKQASAEKRSLAGDQAKPNE
ncbi:MAG: HD domain-containing protein [Solirubrobacterales bacterium]|nr:HD domain-containing protein [Solirubrobacterales bacterium]